MPYLNSVTMLEVFHFKQYSGLELKLRFYNQPILKERVCSLLPFCNI